MKDMPGNWLSWEALYLACFGGAILFATISAFLAPARDEENRELGLTAWDRHPRPARKFGIWNPIVLFAALASFGLVGYLCRLLWSMNGYFSLAPSLIVGLVAGMGVWALFGLVARRHNKGVGLNLAHLVGSRVRAASVIPSNGVGEILLDEGGEGRLAARSTHGASIKRGAEVRINKIVDEVVLVTPTEDAEINDDSQMESGQAE